jgi:hypothetical protein
MVQLWRRFGLDFFSVVSDQIFCQSSGADVLVHRSDTFVWLAVLEELKWQPSVRRFVRDS